MVVSKDRGEQLSALIVSVFSQEQDRPIKEGRQLFLVGLENLLGGRRQSCYYCPGVVNVLAQTFSKVFFKCKIVLFKSNFTLSPFFRSAVVMCKSLTGWRTQKCFWLLNYSTLGLCQAVSSR